MLTTLFFVGISTSVYDDEQDFSGSVKKQDGLNSFPKPIAKILRKFIDSIIHDFIKSWYIYLGPDEEDFTKEVQAVLEFAVTEIYMQLERTDLNNLIVNLIRMFQRHIKVFHDCRNVVKSKYPGISDEDFSSCISELYEAGIIKHIGTRSKGTEIDYLKTLLDIFMYKFLPRKAFSCDGGRFLLREIFAMQLLEPLIREFTDSHFVNTCLIDILEPSIPLPIVLQQWNDAIKKIALEEEYSIANKDEEIDSGEKSSLESSIECNKDGTTLGSSHREQTDITPKHSHNNTSQEHGSEKDHNLIRFDKLDTRTSAPVYGSKSVRDHEYNERTATSEFDTAMSHNESEDTESELISNLKYSMSNDFDSETLAGKDGLAWSICPPATAQLFRKKSFSTMPRMQDELSEQVKAKLNSIGSAVVTLPSNCLNPLPSTCMKSQQTSNTNTDADKFVTNSVAGSVTIAIAKGKKEAVDTTVIFQENLELSSSVDSIINVHTSGIDGAFYEVAPTCPTCIEMTSLASPFVNNKTTSVFNPDRGSTEHVCGLSTKHYFLPETDNECSIVAENLDDESYTSCTYDEDVDESLSSGTLLASTEIYESSNSLDRKDDHDSYDILTSRSGNSSPSSNMSSASFDDIESLSGNEGSHVNRYRSPSVATFKTAIEHSTTTSLETDIVYNKDSTLKYLRKNSSKPKKGSPTNHVVKFFKAGFPLLSKNKTLDGKKNMRKHKNKNNKAVIRKLIKTKQANDQNDHGILENSSVSTSLTKFNSLPDNSGSLPSLWNNRDSFMGNFIEEVALEAVEDDQYLHEFQDSQPQYYSSSPDLTFPVDPLSKEITVTDSRSTKSGKSIKSNESSNKSKENETNSVGSPEKYIPIFKGEVIMPHPSKLPANWLYPIQMVSIPTTEVAYEKGWEPGINKYTLYSIHVSRLVQYV